MHGSWWDDQHHWHNYKLSYCFQQLVWNIWGKGLGQYITELWMSNSVVVMQFIYNIFTDHEIAKKTTAKVKQKSDSKLTKDIPKLTLTCEIWGIYCEYFRENKSCSKWHNTVLRGWRDNIFYSWLRKVSVSDGRHWICGYHLLSLAKLMLSYW